MQTIIFASGPGYFLRCRSEFSIRPANDFCVQFNYEVSPGFSKSVRYRKRKTCEKCFRKNREAVTRYWTKAHD